MGGAKIQSTEGTPQCDNLAMSFYAITTEQIQQLLRVSVPDVKQVLLADDATGAGSLKSLKNWWTNIISEGGRFSNYVKEFWLIIKVKPFYKLLQICLVDDDEVKKCLEDDEVKKCQKEKSV